MSKNLKRFSPAIILALSISFMAFIFEPITLYANNIDDFWFDFYILVKPNLLFFFISFIVLLGIFGIMYFIIKKEKLFFISLMLFNFCFIVAYINGNYLAGFLPSLDGEVMDFSEFLPNLLSISVLVLAFGGIAYLVKKTGVEKGAKTLSYFNLAIFTMLAISLLSTFLTTPVLEKKGLMSVSTTKNLNTASKDKNFFIFLVDAVDSTEFNNIVKSDHDYEKILKDFTYYPDTLSGYDFTRDSIPLIFSGTFNRNEKPFNSYSTEAYNNSPLFNSLSEKGYQQNFYDTEFVWEDEKVSEFENIKLLEEKIKTTSLLKQEFKYLLFKFLPHPLKSFSKIDSMNFGLTKPIEEDELFKWGDANFYHSVLEEPLEKTAGNYFQYIHIEGGHVPFTIDENVDYIDEENGTYPKKLAATMKIVQKYLLRLKGSECYDNSAIVILADHGYDYNDSGRQNPILYIKGVGEKNEKISVSKKQVSYTDLAEAFVEILDEKKASELFSEIPSEGRVRTFIHNGFKTEEHMIEYETSGHAWDKNALTPTGREFNL